MFDYVKPPREIACPECGHPLRDFQTKDGDCYLNTVTDLSEIDHFYTSCDKCRTWVDFVRKVDRKDSLDDFEMTATPRPIPTDPRTPR